MSQLIGGVRKGAAGVRAGPMSALRWLVAGGSVVLAGLAMFFFSSSHVRAQDTNGASQTASTAAAVTVQLNKIEDVKDGCRVFFVISNKTSKAFKTLKIDLILFRTDGVIAKRVFADMAPLRAGSQRQVKLFDLSGIKCGEVGSLLVNDVLECRNEDGVVAQCFSRLEVSHLGDVSLSK